MRTDQQIEQIVASLREIVTEWQEEFGLSKVDSYKRLAYDLSELAHRRRYGWSWRYAQSVLSGTLRPSDAFMMAADLLCLYRDGMPPEFADAKELMVMVVGDQIRRGAIVLGSSRLCAFPGCMIEFVPVVPWQKYCPYHKTNRKLKGL